MKKKNRSLGLCQRFLDTEYFWKNDSVVQVFWNMKNIHSIGACMMFNSFQIDDRYPHGMEDVEFSKESNRPNHCKYKNVSNVSVLHKGQKHQTLFYDNEKSLQKGFTF